MMGRRFRGASLAQYIEKPSLHFVRVVLASPPPSAKICTLTSDFPRSGRSPRDAPPNTLPARLSCDQLQAVEFTKRLRLSRRRLRFPHRRRGTRPEIPIAQSVST